MDKFISCESQYQHSRIVIFGAPFDGTTSYRPGARFAPGAIRNESYGIETYSPALDKDLCDLQVHDAGDLELPFGNPTRVLDMIEDCAARIMQDGKTPVMLGGEHLTTLGAVRAAVKVYGRVNIVHFDAHADLRDDYLGEQLSHATVMRRCRETIQNGNIYQYGIRSGDRQEFAYAAENVFMQKFTLDGVEHLRQCIQDAPCYFTLDLDVLDPSQLCGTGTPEAGGVSYIQLCDALTHVFKLNVIGVDICELSPNYDSSGASTALTCKLLREILLQI